MTPDASREIVDRAHRALGAVEDFPELRRVVNRAILMRKRKIDSGTPQERAEALVRLQELTEDLRTLKESR